MTAARLVYCIVAAGLVALPACQENTCEYRGIQMQAGDEWLCHCHNSCYCQENGRTAKTAMGCTCPYEDTDPPDAEYLHRYGEGCPATFAALQAMCSPGASAFYDACGCGCFDPAGACIPFLECNLRDSACLDYVARCF